MTELEQKKAQYYAYLKELGFSVSLDYEKDMSGIMFADIHETQEAPILVAGKTYIGYRRVEITIHYIATNTAYVKIATALKFLGQEFTVIQNDMRDTDNQNSLTLKGNKYYGN